MRITLTLLLFALTSCRTNPEHEKRIAAADLLTTRYEHSRFSAWKLQATVAGNNCDVLFVRTANVLDDSLVEHLHYGGTDYGIVPGGVHQFYRERHFRAVAYEDATRRVWTYGALTELEGESLPPCR